MWQRRNRPFSLPATAAGPVLVLTLVLVVPLSSSAQSAMSADGIIESGSGGFMFPDGSVQESAVASALTPIDTVPFTISAAGSYYLTGSLTLSAGDAITIDSSDVTLDLMGHTLDGLDTAAYGIRINDSVQNVEIKNGSIVRFTVNGVWADDTTSYLRVTRIRALDNSSTGIRFIGGSAAVVSDCEASGNAGVGIFVGADGSVVRDNISSGNLAGIATAIGVSARLVHNLVESNSNRGIWCLGECAILDNTVRVNNTSDNSMFSGIHANGDNSLVRGNHVTGNLQQNILVSGSGNAIEGNLITNSSIGVNFDATAGDNATANNRWSNHSTADFQNNGIGTIAALDNLAF